LSGHLVCCYQNNRTGHLLVIGEGPEKEAIRMLIHELSLEDRVQFTGFRENHDEIIAR